MMSSNEYRLTFLRFSKCLMGLIIVTSIIQESALGTHSQGNQQTESWIIFNAVTYYQ